MPTFYDEKPIEVLEQTVSAEEYAEAYYTAESSASLISRREIRAGLCVTLAVLCASSIPIYRTRFSTFFGPVCGILAFLGLAAVFFFLQPSDIRDWAKRVFQSNRLLALPQKISVYRDSIVLESDKECFTEYWTDFVRCTETPTLFALIGGRERSLLIVKKEGLSPEQTERISTCLFNAFAARYQKFR